MDLPIVVLKQTLVMAVYLATGLILTKTGIITKEGSKSMSSLLIYFILPFTILNSLCIPFTEEKFAQFFISGGLAILSLAISLGCGFLIFRKSPIDNIAVSFPNAGFIGLPLVSACLGGEAGFFVIPLMALVNVFQWGTSTKLFNKNQKLDFLKIAKSPIVLTAVLGVVIFSLKLGDKIPGIISTALHGVAQTNSPIAMIVLGTYLADVDVKTLFSSIRVYVVCLLRLIAIPLLILAAFLFIPCDNTIKLSVFIAASASVGSNVAVYAREYGEDYAYASKEVVFSTVLSVLTLPLMTMLMQYFLSLV